jgi:uncharacterized membrane protein
MELWEQIVLGAAGLLILFLFTPGIKASIQRSKQAEQKHWGTVILLTVILIAFVMLLISSVQ